MSYETLMFMTFSAEIIQGVTKPSLNLAFTSLRKKIWASYDIKKMSDVENVSNFHRFLGCKLQ
jgi:hypothetical protein